MSLYETIKREGAMGLAALGATMLILVAYEVPKLVRAFIDNPRDPRAALQTWYKD